MSIIQDLLSKTEKVTKPSISSPQNTLNPNSARDKPAENPKEDGFKYSRWRNDSLRRINFLINNSNGNLTRAEIQSVAKRLSSVQSKARSKEHSLSSTNSKRIVENFSEARANDHIDPSYHDSKTKISKRGHKMRLSLHSVNNLSKSELLNLYSNHEGSKIHKRKAFEVPIIKLRKENYLRSDPTYKNRLFHDVHCSMTPQRQLVTQKSKRPAGFKLNLWRSNKKCSKKEYNYVMGRFNHFMRRTKNTPVSLKGSNLRNSMIHMPLST
ncbi:unnamed protein product [Moneuplotes crassus]|uniref:Uncharacterized protein n=1 Tax=Euplotes crassus TaxID=5936 RepID=A0AAD1XEY4_EUPCR|nr:unnamed protein product [Moneuplotes crassus]